jgi:hypothetical protein
LGHDDGMRVQWLFLGVSSSLLGCASVTNVQRADTLGKGNFQVGVEPGVQAAAAGTAFVPYPHLDGSIRFGVSEGVDLGLRAGWSFLELQGKFLVTRPGDPNYAVSIAPTVGGIFVGAAGASAGLLNFGLPVLVGFKFGLNELVLGPRLQGYYVFGSGGTSSTSVGGLILAGGGSVGFAISVAETVAIMPELGVVVPFAGSATVGGSTTGGGLTGAGSLIGQFKVGILIGKQRKPIDPNAEDMSAPPPPPPAFDGPPPPPLPR